MQCDFKSAEKWQKISKYVIFSYFSINILENMTEHRLNPLLKSMSILLCCILLFYAVFRSDNKAEGIAYGLPLPNVVLNQSSDYTPPLIKGLRFDPNDPFNISFILDKGQQHAVPEIQEINRLVSYFLAGLTVPDEDKWVNLSPYEKDRVVPGALSRTELGQDMLSQDYVLKQLSSSLTHPDTSAGRAYWGMENKKLKIENGLTQISNIESLISTEREALSKIWLKPEKSVIYENSNTAFITESVIDVQSDPTPESKVPNPLLPAIKQQVNHGKHFARLRQIYHSQILAAWFKQKFINTYYRAYIDKNKVSGIDTAEKDAEEKIWQLYCKSFKKGVYDLSVPISKKSVKRFFSGGVLTPNRNNITVEHNASSAVTAIESSNGFGQIDIHINARSVSSAAEAQILSKLFYEQQGITGDYIKFLDTVKQQAAQKKGPFTIGIGGPSQTGKSYFIKNMLLEHLHTMGIRTEVLQSDSYRYHDWTVRQMHMQNANTPKAQAEFIKWQELFSDYQNLKKNKEIKAIIIESPYALSREDITHKIGEHIDLGLYFTADQTELKKFYAAHDIYINSGNKFDPEFYDEIIVPDRHFFIEQTKKDADFIFLATGMNGPQGQSRRLFVTQQRAASALSFKEIIGGKDEVFDASQMRRTIRRSLVLMSGAVLMAQDGSPSWDVYNQHHQTLIDYLRSKVEQTENLNNVVNAAEYVTAAALNSITGPTQRHQLYDLPNKFAVKNVDNLDLIDPQIQKLLTKSTLYKEIDGLLKIVDGKSFSQLDAMGLIGEREEGSPYPAPLYIKLEKVWEMMESAEFAADVYMNPDNFSIGTSASAVQNLFAAAKNRFIESRYPGARIRGDYLEFLEMVRTMEKRKKEPLVIGIGGHSQLGKSKYAEILKQHLDIPINVITMDDYFRSMQYHRALNSGSHPEYHDFINWHSLVNVINRKLRLARFRIFVLDGMFALMRNDQNRAFSDLIDMGLFFDADKAQMLEYYIKYGIYEADYLNKHILPQFKLSLDPTRKYADFIVQVSELTPDDRILDFKARKRSFKSELSAISSSIDPLALTEGIQGLYPGKAVGTVRFIDTAGRSSRDIVKELLSVRENEIVVIDEYPANDRAFIRPMAMITHSMSVTNHASTRNITWKIPHAFAADLEIFRKYHGKRIYIEISRDSLFIRLPYPQEKEEDFIPPVDKPYIGPIDLKVKDVLLDWENTKDPSQVSAKFAGLHLIDEQGYYVVKGKVVPYAVYNNVLKINQQKAAQIKQIADSIKNNDPDDMTIKLEQIRDIIMSFDIPDEIWNPIKEYIFSFKNPFCNMRTGSQSEDSEKNPGFGAGVHSSYLNVKREHAKETLKKCWASIWNLGAYQERQRLGVYNFQIMPVVQITEPVEVEYSAVAHTAEPGTGRDNLLVVEIIPGLGEGFNDIPGKAWSFVFDKKTGTIISYEVGSKKLIAVYDKQNGGIKIIEKGNIAQQYMKNIAIEFFYKALHIEYVAERPQDIEAVKTEDRLIFVQRRAQSGYGKLSFVKGKMQQNENWASAVAEISSKGSVLKDKEVREYFLNMIRRIDIHTNIYEVVLLFLKFDSEEKGMLRNLFLVGKGYHGRFEEAFYKLSEEEKIQCLELAAVDTGAFSLEEQKLYKEICLFAITRAIAYNPGHAFSHYDFLSKVSPRILAFVASEIQFKRHSAMLDNGILMSAVKAIAAKYSDSRMSEFKENLSDSALRANNFTVSSSINKNIGGIDMSDSGLEVHGEADKSHASSSLNAVLPEITSLTFEVKSVKDITREDLKRKLQVPV